MLVLSRRVNEKIILPELGITIEVLQTKGKSVRIGIAAPESIRILRGELVESATFANQPECSTADEPALALPVPQANVACPSSV